MSEILEPLIARAIYETMPVGERGWEDAPALTRDRCFVCARAALAAIEASGWVLTPLEPTKAMILAIRVAGPLLPGQSAVAHRYECALQDYRAMLAARPAMRDG
jgi:hypothetical protein